MQQQKMPHTANTWVLYVFDIRPKPVNRVNFFYGQKQSVMIKNGQNGQNGKQWSTTVNTVKKGQIWLKNGLKNGHKLLKPSTMVKNG